MTMGKLTLTAFVTLDGVMQAPGGPREDPSGAFPHGGWVVPHFDDDLGRFVDEVFARADAFLLGRRTHEIFAAHWPRVQADGEPVARALNTLPKHVASTLLREVAWTNSHLLGADLPAEIARLKERYPRELQVHGSAGLVQTLLEHGLVDELRLLTFPVVLGTGKRLFAGGAVPAAMRLTESRTTSAGTIIAVYAFEGRPSYGTFAIEDERVVAD
jgi:dihydrofolate reductase